MNSAREGMLSAIRNALRDRAGFNELPQEPAGFSMPGRGSVGGEAGGVPGGVAQDPLDLLESRISDYQATVWRCHPSTLSDLVLECLRSRRVGRLVAPSDLPEEWISGASAAGIELLMDGGPSLLSTAQLASVDAVVTGCALAIAETGTLVLDGGVGQGRRVISLLPDYHLCIVMKEQVVGTISEGVSSLQLSQGADPGPLTLISGPSATSDIELIRVEGVHGPRTLDVILVEDH